MSYKLYFLLDRAKTIVPGDLLDYMLEDSLFSYQVTNDNDVVVTYKDNNIVFEATIYLKTKSVLPNLHLLDPKYKNINISLELEPLIPRFKLNLFLDKLENICKKFDLCIYTEFFQDVQAFKKDDILYTYDMYKDAYKVKYPEEVKDLYKVDKIKLSDYLLYVNEFSRVKKLFLETGIIVPEILFNVDEGSKQVKTTIEWDGSSNILIPPFIDYILYNNNGNKEHILASEFSAVLKKYMANVPGFIPGTKAITEKKLKKIQKVISKTRFSPVPRKAKYILQTSLID